MKTKNVELRLPVGTEVHGPDGWQSLLGDCTVEATLDSLLRDRWHYKVRDDDWYVLAVDVVAPHA